MTTPYQGILNKGVQATWAFGCDIDSEGMVKLTTHVPDTSGFEEAIQNAKEADVAILFLGIDGTIEYESEDRVNITLPGVQDQLAQAIFATGTPTVVVLINGGALAIGEECSELY